MKRKYLKKILGLFAEYRVAVVMIIIYMLILTGLSYCLPFFSRSLIDDGFIKQDKGRIIFCALSILGLNAAIILINILKRKQAIKMNIGVRAKMHREVFNYLLHVRISYFQDKNATSTFQCIEDDITNIASLVNDSSISAITAIFSAIGGGIALFTIDWHLGLAVVLFTPVNIIVSDLFARKNKSMISKTLKLRRKYTSWYGETLVGVREIRLFGLQNAKKKEMEDQLSELYGVTKDCNMLLTCNTQIQLLLTEVLKALIYVLAAYYMIKSNLTVGSVVAFQSYMLMVSSSEAMIIGLFFSFFAMFPHFKRYYEFFEEPTEIHTDAHLDYQNGEIAFRHVSFSYEEGGKDLFRDVSLALPCGSKTVIIGDNGAGKTTFINLLLSLLEPVSGSITVNGRDIRGINLEEYRQLFSVVSQEVFLFHDTLINNITLGKDVPKETLDAIIKDVNLESVMEKYGPDYEITENGSNLSGGQKQKIALARALVMDRPVLVFDEATSNLDRMSIRSFIELFDTRLRDTTVICVSHSDEIIDYFDNRIVFSDGSVSLEHITASEDKKAI